MQRRRLFRFGILALSISTTLLLTACGPTNPDTRPTDEQLKDAISLLVKNFTIKHPQLVTWNPIKVNAQLSAKLPEGVSTEAGYLLKWPKYVEGELPEVYVPWDLIGQYPNTFKKTLTSYNESDGKPVPASVLNLIRRDQLKNVGGDNYFAAIIGVRYSRVESKWVVFTSIPFLPVTDPAYGWATIKNGRWAVTDFGTALVGCGVVPLTVQAEFGYSCPNN